MPRAHSDVMQWAHLSFCTFTEEFYWTRRCEDNAEKRKTWREYVTTSDHKFRSIRVKTSGSYSITSNWRRRWKVATIYYYSPVEYVIRSLWQDERNKYDRRSFGTLKLKYIRPVRCPFWILSHFGITMHMYMCKSKRTQNRWSEHFGISLWI